MRCENCKKFLPPDWCDQFDITTEPDKECDGCPEATPKKNARVRMKLHTVGQLVQEYYEEHGCPTNLSEFNDMARHFYMRGFNNGALEENRKWTTSALTAKFICKVNP